MKKIIGRIAVGALMLVFLGVFGVSIYRLATYYINANQTESVMSELRNTMPESTPRPSPVATTGPDGVIVTPEPTERVWEISENFKPLHERNEEIVGWITIDGTNIDYPVMQSAASEPEKYLKIGFEGSPDSNGVPFLDYRCSITPRSGNLLIYGHNMNSKIMFHHLTDYESQEFWQEHRYIIFDTLYDEGTYEVASAFLYVATNAAGTDRFHFHEYVDFPDEDTFDEYLSEVDKIKLYSTDVEINWGDELLILATCEYSNQNGRFVVLAKKVA